MAREFKIISVDDHVQEPPDLWTGRLSSQKWGDRLPHVARKPDGAEQWVINGKVRADWPLASTGALFEERLDEPKTWDQVPKAAYDPTERLKAMDQDGIDVQVLYPSASGVGGETLNAIDDPELELACVQAYNDWLLDVWGKASPRFVPQCLVPVSSVEAAAKELERAVKGGHRGVVLPHAPWSINAKSPHLFTEAWDPFWAKATELNVPVCFHSGSAPAILIDLHSGFDPAVAKGFDIARRASTGSMALPRFLFGGIGERFPKVPFIFTGTGIGWVPYSLEVSDYEWGRSCRAGALPYTMDTKPSEIFHRQVYVTSSYDIAGLKLRSFIGVDNILWHSEFPLATSLWPNSVETIKKNFEGVPDQERTRILSDTAAKLYKIS